MTAAPLTIARPVRCFALAGFGSSGSGNGLNVRTMRTEFPPGRKGGEPQQENRLGVGLGMVSQVAHGFSGEGVERVLAAYGS